MTADEFQAFWESTYPLSLPLSYYLRVDYDSRWFRIHSLPESQRYPNNDSDWAILLNRQNALITDLVGSNSNLLLVTGEYVYNYDGDQEHQFTFEESIKHLDFTSLKVAVLGDTRYDASVPDDEKSLITYRPVVAEITWVPGKYDSILRDVASERLRVMFISVSKMCIIAPYDGGVDVILEDIVIRDFYKLKYKEWLSLREDGL